MQSTMISTRNIENQKKPQILPSKEGGKKDGKSCCLSFGGRERLGLTGAMVEVREGGDEFAKKPQICYRCFCAFARERVSACQRGGERLCEGMERGEIEYSNLSCRFQGLRWECLFFGFLLCPRNCPL